ncbi:MAG TPA: SLC13 family permease, partial [Thermoanaerobaculia bacterium]|nr:SLC13 family permease [Thermoanaerobaculia bacterium]
LVALALFATEVVTVDVAALVLLLGLYFSGLVAAEDIFRGFGNETIVFLASLFVLTEALVRSHALERLEIAIVRIAERRPKLVLPLLSTFTGTVSAFLSNVATVAALLPLSMGLSHRLRRPPSRLLMPIAFASILGGTCSLIGTSTNIVVSGILPRYGLEPLGLFELAPIGLPTLVLGLLYLWTLGQRLLPDTGAEPIEVYRVRDYLGEVVVPAGSPWIGKTIEQTHAGRDLEVDFLGLVPDEGPIRPVPHERVLRAGDVLLAKGSQKSLLALKDRVELSLQVDSKWSENAAGRVPIHELVLAPSSRLAGHTLEELQLRARYGITVLAVYRRGETFNVRLARTRLRAGDVLLVQGDLAPLGWLLASGDAILLEGTEYRPGGRRAHLTVGLFLATIVAGGMGWVPFSLAALSAAVILLLTGAIDPGEAYAAIHWRVLILVGSLLALATAMETTGAAAYLAQRIVDLAGEGGGIMLLGGFYSLTLLLTQPMSNQAAALVVLPIAVRTAAHADLDPRAFAVTVCVAASCSFITPLEPASLLVYGPGKYRFRDFTVVGLPLSLLCMAVTLLVVPRVWPL